MRPPLTPEERQALTDPGTLAKATAAAPFATACQSQVEMSAPLPSRNVLFSVRRVVFVRRSEGTQRRRSGCPGHDPGTAPPLLCRGSSATLEPDGTNSGCGFLLARVV